MGRGHSGGAGMSGEQRNRKPGDGAPARVVEPALLPGRARNRKENKHKTREGSILRFTDSPLGFFLVMAWLSPVMCYGGGSDEELNKHDTQRWRLLRHRMEFRSYSGV